MVDEIQRQRQKPQSSNALDNYYGWNSSMGRDLRVDPELPLQYQYRDKGRTVVSDTEPAFTDMGRNRNVPFPQTRTPSNIGFDRMGASYSPSYGGGFPGNTMGLMQGDIRDTHHFPSMMGGLGSLQASVDPSDWRTIIKIIKAGGDPGTETQVANKGIGSTNEYQTAGLFQTWKKILERTGNEDLANQWLESQYAI